MKLYDICEQNVIECVKKYQQNHHISKNITSKTTEKQKLDKHKIKENTVMQGINCTPLYDVFVCDGIVISKIYLFKKGSIPADKLI